MLARSGANCARDAPPRARLPCWLVELVDPHTAPLLAACCAVMQVHVVCHTDGGRQQLACDGGVRWLVHGRRDGGLRNAWGRTRTLPKDGWVGLFSRFWTPFTDGRKVAEELHRTCQAPPPPDF